MSHHQSGAVPVTIQLDSDFLAELRELQNLCSHSLKGSRELKDAIQYSVRKVLKVKRAETKGYRKVATEEAAEKKPTPELNGVDRVTFTESNLTSLSGAPKMPIFPSILPNPSLRKPIPRTLKRFLYERAGHRCQYTNCESKFFLQIHHLIPLSYGGRMFDPDNLKVYCHQHHQTFHHVDDVKSRQRTGQLW